MSDDEEKLMEDWQYDHYQAAIRRNEALVKLFKKVINHLVDERLDEREVRNKNDHTN